MARARKNPTNRKRTTVVKPTEINMRVSRVPVFELGQNNFTTFTDLVRKKMNNDKMETGTVTGTGTKTETKATKEEEKNHQIRINGVIDALLGTVCSCSFHNFGSDFVSLKIMCEIFIDFTSLWIIFYYNSMKFQCNVEDARNE